MERKVSVLAVVLLVCPVLTPAQVKEAASAAANPASLVQTLVQEGKILEAADLASKHPSIVPGVVKSLLDIADIAVSERQIPKAQATLDKTFIFVEAYRKSNGTTGLPGEPLRARQLRLEGIKLNDNNEFEKAIIPLREALEISRKTADPGLEAGVHNNLGVAMQSLNRLEEARSEFEASVRIAEARNDVFRAGSSLFNLGRVQLQLSQFDAALTSFRNAEARFKVVSRTNLEARAIMMQGVTLGKIDPASSQVVKHFERAQKISQEAGDLRNAGWIYYLIGDHIARSQKYAEAAEYGERAVPYLRDAGDKDGLQQCYEFLADMYGKIDKKDLAQRYRELAGKTTGK